MKTRQGKPLPLGVTILEGEINFSVAVPKGKECRLLLYHVGETEPCMSYQMQPSVGEVHCLTIEGLNPQNYEYNYQIENEVMVDPYVRALAGKEIWGQQRNIQKHEIRGVFCNETYDWECDLPLQLPYHKVVAYSLHVRGFTKHTSSHVKAKGTFQGIIEKIPYLKDLGINQIHCMPVYEFEECMKYRNYWGYGKAYFFAPKSSYAKSGNAVKELKDMVKACHKEGIEIILEMPFTDQTPKQMIEECLRYYLMEYHIDGFILNPLIAPMKGILEDPVLKRTKVMVHNFEFQNVIRRFLKGDEGMVDGVIYWLRRPSEKEGSFNAITTHTGFTLNDLVSYDGKHNELNGENNQDGPDYNYSWNCGTEGPTRKKTILELRNKQKRNAFLLMILAQGTPCILAGDEFANSQKGNNNVYCQDNPIGWVDWSKLEKEKELHDFVKELIAIRKTYKAFCQEKELLGMDQKKCGVPDVSYHGESAWQVPSEISSRQLGVYYSGDMVDGEDCFIAYNMHWMEHSFALPALSKNRRWYQIASTESGVLEKKEVLENQRIVRLKERTIMVLIGQ